MKAAELSDEELALTYGLEPTTIENLKASQVAYRKMGVEMTVEEIYFLEFDYPDRGGVEEEK